MYAIIDAPTRQIIGLSSTNESIGQDSFVVPIHDEAIYRLLLSEPFRYCEYSIQSTPSPHIVLKNRPTDTPSLLHYSTTQGSELLLTIDCLTGVVKLTTYYNDCVVLLVAKDTLLVPVCTITIDSAPNIPINTLHNFINSYSVYCNYALSTYSMVELNKPTLQSCN